MSGRDLQCIEVLSEVLARRLSRCTQIPESRFLVFNCFRDLSTWVSCTETPERCTQKPEEVQVKVRPAFECTDGHIPFICSKGRPVFECKTSQIFREYSAVNDAKWHYSGI